MSAHAGIEAIKAIADELGLNISDCCDLDKLYRACIRSIKVTLDKSEKIRRHEHRRQLTTRDINESLQTNKKQKLYGYGAQTNFQYYQIKNTEILAPHDKTLYLENTSITIPQKRVPIDTFFHFHWLAIDGIQPFIPENLSDVHTDFVMPEEMSWNDEMKGFRNPRTASVPLNLQKIFSTIVNRFINDDDVSMLASEIVSDASIGPIVAYIIRVVIDFIKHNARNASEMRRSLILLTALLQNNSITLDNYMSSFLSVARYFLYQQDVHDVSDLRFILIEESANFMDLVIRKFETKAPKIRNIVLEEIISIFNSESTTLQQKYGSIYGLFILSRELFTEHILGKAYGFVTDIHSKLSYVTEDKKIEILKLISMIISSAKQCNIDLNNSGSNKVVPRLKELIYFRVA